MTTAAIYWVLKHWAKCFTDFLSLTPQGHAARWTLWSQFIRSGSRDSEWEIYLSKDTQLDSNQDCLIPKCLCHLRFASEYGWWLVIRRWFCRKPSMLIQSCLRSCIHSMHVYWTRPEGESWGSEHTIEKALTPEMQEAKVVITATNVGFLFPGLPGNDITSSDRILFFPMKVAQSKELAQDKEAASDPFHPPTIREPQDAAHVSPDDYFQGLLTLLVVLCPSGAPWPQLGGGRCSPSLTACF